MEYSNGLNWWQWKSLIGLATGIIKRQIYTGNTKTDTGTLDIKTELGNEHSTRLIQLYKQGLKRFLKIIIIIKANLYSNIIMNLFVFLIFSSSFFELNRICYRMFACLAWSNELQHHTATTHWIGGYSRNCSLARTFSCIYFPFYFFARFLSFPFSIEFFGLNSLVDETCTLVWLNVAKFASAYINWLDQSVPAVKPAKL